MLTAVTFCSQITALKIKHNPFAKAFLDAKERYEIKSQIYASVIKLVYTYSTASNIIVLFAGATIRTSLITVQTVNSLATLSVSFFYFYISACSKTIVQRRQQNASPELKRTMFKLKSEMS